MEIRGHGPMLMLFWRDRRAATAIEYAFVAGMISLAIVAGVRTIAPRLTAIFGNAASNLS